MPSRQYYVYILASGKNGTLYVGITNDILRRVRDHKEGAVPGFTKKYGVNRLVYFDVTENVIEAITVEKRYKRWRRKWKVDLIEKDNPGWNDLYYEFVDGD